ncbi:MAG: hypothetical protein ACP5XB_14700 [Isosphaeraceae bacterium]
MSSSLPSFPAVSSIHGSRTAYRHDAEKVAERLLDYLMRIDEVRGAGRIYVP